MPGLNVTSGVELLPQQLQRLGYTVAMAGKQHLNNVPRDIGFAQTFINLNVMLHGSHFWPNPGPSQMAAHFQAFFSERRAAGMLTGKALAFVYGATEPHLPYRRSDHGNQTWIEYAQDPNITLPRGYQNSHVGRAVAEQVYVQHAFCTFVKVAIGSFFFCAVCFLPILEAGVRG